MLFRTLGPIENYQLYYDDITKIYYGQKKKTIIIIDLSSKNYVFVWFLTFRITVKTRRLFKKKNYYYHHDTVTVILDT